MPQEDGQLVDKIVDALEGAILSGEILPGKRISELYLSSTLKVSRGPLREAIRKLEARRLFERTAFHGIRLVDLSIEDLEQLLVVREFLEGAAARAAAENISKDGLAQLKAYVNESAQPKLPLTFVPREDGFHHLVAKASKNRWLEEMLCKDLYGLLRAYRYASSNFPHRSEEALAEHRAIVKAISQGDGDRAERLMRLHNRNGRIRLIKQLKDECDGVSQSSLRPIVRRRTKRDQ